MFILKFQARKAEKLLQANLQSPTRIKISRNQMCMRLFFHRFVNRELNNRFEKKLCSVLKKLQARKNCYKNKHSPELIVECPSFLEVVDNITSLNIYVIYDLTANCVLCLCARRSSVCDES